MAAANCAGSRDDTRASYADTRGETDLLRLATAGSVDDGKSTLIGRLLYETKEIFEDQLAAVERASLQRGGEYVNLALLTDGLRAEREQGITIDVAYRYFATPRRRFILADTPGHVQYTRNMVTGTSTADVAIVLVDARKGMTDQTRRHLSIVALLGVPHVVLCFNKMDLVDYSERTFDALDAEVRSFARNLGLDNLTSIPVSALHGENVIQRSARMPWYGGPSFLEHLENIPIVLVRETGARFPVQWVIRPLAARHHDYRGYAGQLAGGALQAGDEVLALPHGSRTRVRTVEVSGRPVALARPGMSITVTLEDDLDVSRGDLLCAPDDPPTVSHDLEATVCWLSTTPLDLARPYALKHTTRSTRARVQSVDYRLNISNLERERGVTTVGLNDIARLTIRSMTPLAYDPYQRNRTTGSFILVDEASHETAAAGMLV